MFQVIRLDNIDDIDTARRGVAALPLNTRALRFDLGRDLFSELREIARVANASGPNRLRIMYVAIAPPIEKLTPVTLAMCGVFRW